VSCQVKPARPAAYNAGEPEAAKGLAPPGVRPFEDCDLMSSRRAAVRRMPDQALSELFAGEPDSLSEPSFSRKTHN